MSEENSNKEVKRIDNPFGKSIEPRGAGALAASEMNRQVAEIQSRITLARANPRNQRLCLDRIINACTRASLAESAHYEYSRGGTAIKAPSIRLAEAIAQEWENMEFGFRELQRGIADDGVGFSDVEAFAWDLERNTRRPVSFRVRHWRDTKKGGYAITDERDIYELIANQAQRRVRASILALVPGDVTEAASRQCDVTLKSSSSGSTDPENVEKMLKVFDRYGIKKQHIEAFIQRRIDAIQPAQMIRLRNIANSLRDGMASPEDWFDMSIETKEETAKKQPEGLSDDDFSNNLKSYADLIDSGKTTSEKLIVRLGRKYKLSEEQINVLKNL